MTTLQDIIKSPEFAKEIQKDTIKDSILGQIADTTKMNYPETTLTYQYRDAAQDKIIVNSRVLETKNYLTNTRYTMEALDDLFHLYGTDIKEVLTHYIKTEQVRDLDKDLIAFMNANATFTGTLDFSATTHSDFGNIYSAIFSKINYERVRLTVTAKGNLSTFCIVTPKIAAGILDKFLSGVNLIEKDGLAYIGSLGKNDFYLDVDHTDPTLDDYVIVGKKGDGFFGASIVKGEYQTLNYPAVDPDTGETVLFYSNRVGFQLTAADTEPLNTNSSSFLRKFNVNLKHFGI